jgi:hypothetical protein
MGGMALAQSATVLYQPARSLKDQQISLRAWGSGTVSETDEMAFEGTNSVRISTRNFFQGGILRFGAPATLSSQFEDRNNLLRITFMSADSGVRGFGGQRGGPGGFGPGGLGAPGGGGIPGGAGIPGGVGGPGGLGAPRGGGVAGGGRGGGRQGGATAGGRGGARQGGIPGTGGIPGGFGGQGGPGGIGGPGGLGAPGGGGMGGMRAPEQGMRMMRVIITTTDGKRSEAYLPVNLRAVDQRGWSSVAVPLQAISGFERTNKVVSEVALSADTTATFFLGDLRIVNDSTPLRCEPNVRTLNLALGDEVTFSATGSGGASILKFTWDFDSSDGVQIDAEGQVVRRRFRKPGTFTVTVTVSDTFGLKQPYSTDIKVVVNP